MDSVASECQRKIKPIESHHVVQNGALIVVSGGPQSGKTCIVENLLLHCLESFVQKKFPPFYIGADAEKARAYFGDLFDSYHCLADGCNKEVLAQAQIWQYGFQNECAKAQLKQQGQKYVEAQKHGLIGANQSEKIRPQLLFYFEKVNNWDFVSDCLEQTPDHRASKTISIVETDNMHSFGRLNPQIVIFSSLLNYETHVPFLRHLLQCSAAVAKDLVETANTFIGERSIALLLNLNQWFSSQTKRGLFIYKYDLVPPLFEKVCALQHGKNIRSITEIGSEKRATDKKMCQSKRRKRHSAKGSSTTQK